MLVSFSDRFSLKVVSTKKFVSFCQTENLSQVKDFSGKQKELAVIFPQDFEEVPMFST